jgi:universal stress protein E
MNAIRGDEVVREQSIDRSSAVLSDIGGRKFKLDRIQKVLCATDLRPSSDAVVSRAHAIARGLGAQLLLLHVVDPTESARAIRRHGGQVRFALDAQARKLARLGNGAEISVRAGPPHKAIAAVAIEWDADLIVLGRYRQHFGDSFRGTSAERVIRKAGRPVLVVNRESAGPYEHVLLACDLSRMSAGIVSVAKGLGLLEDSQASVVHALQPTDSAMLYMAGVTESEVSRYRQALRQLASDEIKTQLASAGLNSPRFSILSQSSPVRAIEEVARRIGSDLVVVGTSRFPLLKRMFIGSVSNEVVRGLTHDVLLISPAAVRRTRRHAGRVVRRPSQNAGRRVREMH